MSRNKKVRKSEKALQSGEKSKKPEKAARAGKKAKKPEKESQEEKKLKKPEKTSQEEKKLKKSEKTSQAEKKLKKPEKASQAEKKLKKPENELQIKGKFQNQGEMPQIERNVGQGKISRNRAASLFHALADDNRLRILELLNERGLCAAELLQSLDIAQSTVSHHMKCLCDSGLVTCTRKGRNACYSVNSENLAWILEYIAQWMKER